MTIEKACSQLLPIKPLRGSTFEISGSNCDAEPDRRGGVGEGSGLPVYLYTGLPVTGALPLHAYRPEASADFRGPGG